MEIRDYLKAVVGEYKEVSAGSFKYEHVVDSIKDVNKAFIDEDGDIEFLMIRSADCKSKMVRFGGRSYIIINRQADLYINALVKAELLHEVEGFDYNDCFYQAIVYIASNHFAFKGMKTFADFIVKERNGLSFNSVHKLNEQIQRMFFVSLHELGHVRYKSDKVLSNDLQDDVNQVFEEHILSMIQSSINQGEHLKKLYYQTTYKNQFNTANLEECCVDYYSAIIYFHLLEIKGSYLPMFGGYERFVTTALRGIHNFNIISHILEVVELVLSGKEYHDDNLMQNMQRFRVTRQVYSRLLLDSVGVDKARANFADFTEYLQRVDSPHNKELFKKLYSELSEKFQSRKWPDEEHISTAYSGRYEWE